MKLKIQKNFFMSGIYRFVINVSSLEVLFPIPFPSWTTGDSAPHVALPMHLVRVFLDWINKGSCIFKAIFFFLSYIKGKAARKPRTKHTQEKTSQEPRLWGLHTNFPHRKGVRCKSAHGSISPNTGCRSQFQKSGPPQTQSTTSKLMLLNQGYFSRKE